MSSLSIEIYLVWQVLLNDIYDIPEPLKTMLIGKHVALLGRSQAQDDIQNWIRPRLLSCSESLLCPPMPRSDHGTQICTYWRWHDTQNWILKLWTHNWILTNGTEIWILKQWTQNWILKHWKHISILRNGTQNWILTHGTKMNQMNRIADTSDDHAWLCVMVISKSTHEVRIFNLVVEHLGLVLQDKPKTVLDWKTSACGLMLDSSVLLFGSSRPAPDCSNVLRKQRS